MRAKEELKKGLDAATRKAEREIKSAKDEAANFKTKLDDMEQKLTRVSQKIKKNSNDVINIFGKMANQGGTGSKSFQRQDPATRGRLAEGARSTHRSSHRLRSRTQSNQLKLQLK